MIGLLARKIGMTQVYDEQGRVVPVTLLAAGPCTVAQVKTPERDGYAAVQLGFGPRREKRVSRAVRGHLKKHGGLGAVATLREMRVDDATAFTPGQSLTVAQFEVGSLVDVVGVSKGRGFAGVTRRHHFTGGQCLPAERRQERVCGGISRNICRQRDTSVGKRRLGASGDHRYDSAISSGYRFHARKADSSRNRAVDCRGDPSYPQRRVHS